MSDTHDTENRPDDIQRDEPNRNMQTADKPLSEKELKQAAKEAKKLEKVKKIFKKRYTKRSLNKKIYKKIFIPADREFIQGFIVSRFDEKKKKEFYEFDKTAINDKSQLKRINRIAKEIGRQKSRINVPAVAGALLCVFAVIFFIYIFRNFLARKIIVGASEAAFGAKCEVSLVDFDLLHTRFRIQGYKVANKNAPMRNLFEIANIDFYFNLLELSRGKFVAENMAVEGLTWNTERKTSGALPPKKQKRKDPNKKPNPVTALIEKEINKVKAGVSVDSGLKAVQDQVDPRKILEREKAAFKTPALIDDIKSKVDPLTSKWVGTKDEVQKQSVKLIEASKKLAAIDVSSINDVAELTKLIETITQVSAAGKESFDLANGIAKNIQADVKTVEQLVKSADTAIKNDFNRVKDIAGKIKSINADTGKKLISDLIQIFIVNTLGNYYPYYAQGMAYLQSMQRQPKKEKEMTLAQKSKAMQRLPGKTFIFGKNALPTFVIKNISLSGHHPEKDVFAVAGGASGISNDADKLGLPLKLFLTTEHGKLKERADGLIDLRSYTEELVDTAFTFEGLELSIPSPADAVPSLSGVLKTGGGVKVSKKHDVTINADVRIAGSTLSVPDFEPAFVCDIYRNILADIKNINATVELIINKGENFKLNVDTDVDNQIAAALKKEFARQVEKVKAQLIRESEKWLNEQREIYKDEIKKFTDAANRVKKIVNDIQNCENILDKKKAEAEKRIKELAAGKLNDVKKEAENAVKDVFKGFF